MKIEITGGKNIIYLEESSGGTVILNLALEGISLYFYVSEKSNLTLNKEKGKQVEEER